MGRGTKLPCPGCKAENTGRRSDGVCFACRKLLSAAAAQEKYDAERQVAGKKLYQIPWFWPHIYMHGGRSGSHAGDVLSKLLVEVLVSAGERSSAGDEYGSALVGLTGDSLFPDVKRREKSGGCRGSVWVPVEFADNLAALDMSIREAIDAAYESGKAEGQDLISGLASGEVSLQQLNKATIQRKRVPVSAVGADEEESE